MPLNFHIKSPTHEPSNISANASPIFPSEVFSPVDFSFQIPENEIVSTHSVSLSIVLAEPILFLRGFTPQEFQDKPPSILRGTLIVRVLKPTKVKSISLTFKGIAKTEWPEGIPPKKTETNETKILHSHTWTFFNASFPTSDFTSGANMVRFQKDNTHRLNLALNSFDLSSDSSSNNSSNRNKNASQVRNRNQTDTQSATQSSEAYRISHHARSASNPGNHMNRSESTDSLNAIKAFADRLRRAASPSPVPLSRSHHQSSSSKDHHDNSISNRSNSQTPIARTAHSPSRDKDGNLSSAFVHTLVPRRSFSKDEPVESETSSKGYRTFEPGEYYYNFELPIPQSLPESIECNFGSVKYILDASIDRPGTFRTKVSGTKDVLIVRAPSDNNLEISEPIAISKSWDDQLYYEIVISGKTFPIDTKIPIAFKLTPLAKVELHRIRVYVTENSEYYCKNKRVHRIEPTRKFLLHELLSKEGLTGNLLQELATSNTEDGISIEHEMNPLIPKEFPLKKEVLHPNTTYENIKVHHWIKIVLRLSRSDPKSSVSGKRKHYEISIDSPIHLLDTHCTNSNVYLPAYIDPVSRRRSVISHRPVPTDELDSHLNTEMRPIHFLRKPSIAPPPFDADDSPPPLVPELPLTIREQELSRSNNATAQTPTTPTYPLISDLLAASNGVDVPPDTDAPPTYEFATRENSQSYTDRFNVYQELRRKSKEEKEIRAQRRMQEARRNIPSTIVEQRNSPVLGATDSAVSSSHQSSDNRNGLNESAFSLGSNILPLSSSSANPLTLSRIPSASRSAVSVNTTTSSQSSDTVLSSSSSVSASSASSSLFFQARNNRQADTQSQDENNFNRAQTNSTSSTAQASTRSQSSQEINGMESSQFSDMTSIESPANGTNNVSNHKAIPMTANSTNENNTPTSDAFAASTSNSSAQSANTVIANSNPVYSNVQLNNTVSSVDIVDQVALDPEDPLSPAFGSTTIASSRVPPQKKPDFVKQSTTENRKQTTTENRKQSHSPLYPVQSNESYLSSTGSTHVSSPNMSPFIPPSSGYTERENQAPTRYYLPEFEGTTGELQAPLLGSRNPSVVSAFSGELSNSPGLVTAAQNQTKSKGNRQQSQASLGSEVMRLDSIGDIGLTHTTDRDIIEDDDDDQLSLTSTPSLWIA